MNDGSERAIIHGCKNDPVASNFYLGKAGQFGERKTNEIFLYLEGAATMLPADS